MIYQSLTLGNLVVSLCMKIINSVVVVGLYYGFLTTFSIGTSYLFLLRALVMEQGTEKMVSATTGFIMGQLIMFISIYYAPLHLALDRPHTITALALPYLLFHFFSHNHKDVFDYGSTTRNSMRNFSIQCVFLNNLIFPLFNHFFLPSSMLARLVNIYMFRCNNKMLFVTSGFVGWLIGHILFIKWLGFVLVWIRQNKFKLKKLIRLNKYLVYTTYFVSDLIDSMAAVFSILLFVLCLYEAGKMPSPILTFKMYECSKLEEEEERDVEIERAFEMKWTNQEQKGFTEEDPFLSEEKADPNKIDETEDELHFRFTETGYKNRPVSDSDSEESYLMNMNENHDNSRFKIFENKDLFFFNKPLFLTLLFDLNRWNQPFRYIKNNRFEWAVRKEMSQYFFDICQSDGKERISFTYPPSLSIFLEMIKRRISPHTLEKSSSNELDNPWVYTNKQKVKNFNNELRNRIEALDKKDKKKKYILLDILETRTRLCNDDSKKEYLSQRYDPFLNGSYRRTIYKSLSPSIRKKTWLNNFIEKFGINRIHDLLLPDTDYDEFEQKINRFDKEPLSTEIVTDENGQDENGQKISIKSIRLEEISKKVPRWSYKLISDIELELDDCDGEIREDYDIRARRAVPEIVFTANEQDLDPTIVNPSPSSEPEEVFFMRYIFASDFRRGLIKGSMRSQRRKISLGEAYQPHAHSHLYLDRIRKFPFFVYGAARRIVGVIKLILKIRNWLPKWEIVKTFRTRERELDEKNQQKAHSEEMRITAAESWDFITCGQIIRSALLLTHAYFRKYILFPSLIIAKNIGRLLLSQRPEWSEDFQEWNKEMHVLCTYNGVPLSEREFPSFWWVQGLQIKILFPFHLKPWHKSNLESSEKDLMENNNEKETFGFLTVFGVLTDRPFGLPRKSRSFFWKPIFKELVKKMRKLPKRALLVFKKQIKLFQQVSKETKKWVQKWVQKSSNQRIHESFNQIPSPSQKKSSVTEKKMTEKEKKMKEKIKEKEKKIKDTTDRTSTIRNQIERIKKDKKKGTPRINNLSPNKTSSNAKRFEKWEILKRRTAGLIGKLPLFFKSFIQRIYTDIFLSIMNIPRMNTELCLESTKEECLESTKGDYNNEGKQERIHNSNNEGKQEKINKKKKNRIPFISTIKKTLDSLSKNQIISYLFSNLSCLSQAYVFYKLSHQLSNSSKSVLQDQGSPFFLKPEIKAPFETQGMGYSGYEMNHWKTCLRGIRGHYQYDLSQIRWSRLIPEKWRNTVHQRGIAENANFSKCHSKDQLIDFKKQKQFEVYSLSNQKENFQKNYRYDLLSYQFLNFENKRECCFYRSPFQGNTNQEISYKTADRKYFDRKILNFDLRQKVGSKALITIDTNRNQKIQIRNQKTQIRTNNSFRIPKKDLLIPDKKDLLIPEINPPNSDKGFFEWNRELWFFPEFGLLYNAYKTKPWVIPSKLLLLKNSEKGKKQEIFTAESELDSFLKRFFIYQVELDETLDDKMIDNLKLFCFLLRRKSLPEMLVSLVERRKFHFDVMPIGLDDDEYTAMELKDGLFCLESIPLPLSGKKDGQFLMYQTIGTSLVDKRKQQTNQKYQEQRYLSKNNFDEAISAHDRISRNRDKNHFDLLVPENILSFRHRRKFRILISLNSKNRNDVDRNPVFWNGKNVKKSRQVSHDNNHLDREKNQLKLMKLKHFLWPNYRLEDLACMNRYWFDTNNGSRFSMLRIHLYPRLKIPFKFVKIRR